MATNGQMFTQQLETNTHKCLISKKEHLSARPHSAWGKSNPKLFCEFSIVYTIKLARIMFFDLTSHHRNLVRTITDHHTSQ